MRILQRFAQRAKGLDRAVQGIVRCPQESLRPTLQRIEVNGKAESRVTQDTRERKKGLVVLTNPNLIVVTVGFVLG